MGERAIGDMANEKNSLKDTLSFYIYYTMATLAVDPWDYPTGGGMAMSMCVPTLPFGRRKIGRLVVYLESKRRRKNGLPKFLCVAGPCWPMFLVTTSLIVGISYVILATALPKLSAFWWILDFSTLINLLTAFFLTGCSDPGIQPRYVDIVDGEDVENGRITTGATGKSSDETDEEDGNIISSRNRTVNSKYSNNDEEEENLSLKPRNISKDELIWCEEAQAYRVRGVQYCNETQTLIEDIDHFCPWTGTTIGSGNIKYFYWFLISLFVHMGSTFGSMFASIGM